MKNMYFGPKRLTRFERSRIVGARALQLSQGAPRLVNPPPDITNSIVISELELQERILPLTIRRTLPSGEFVDISLKMLTQVTKPVRRQTKKKPTKAKKKPSKPKKKATKTEKKPSKSKKAPRRRKKT